MRGWGEKRAGEVTCLSRDSFTLVFGCRVHYIRSFVRYIFVIRNNKDKSAFLHPYIAYNYVLYYYI